MRRRHRRGMVPPLGRVGCRSRSGTGCSARFPSPVPPRTDVRRLPVSIATGQLGTQRSGPPSQCLAVWGMTQDHVRRPASTHLTSEHVQRASAMPSRFPPSCSCIGARARMMGSQAGFSAVPQPSHCFAWSVAGAVTSNSLKPVHQQCPPAGCRSTEWPPPPVPPLPGCRRAARARAPGC
jgi:hypothetical protein